MRIGHGYDVHRFGDGEAVTLGGVRIAHTHGLVAHSDGDVALHALCDALLGAIAAGDIGHHFPDSDVRYRGADSRELLRACMALVRAAGYRLGNADLTIVAEAPRLAPHIAAMRTNIVADLGARAADVNVKATTSEGLGFTGRREGIAAHAVVLLVREDHAA
ncbi:MAG: 2-C-methyl-D-erythritol 2,4-cyclodiphosphate synthase [Pseudomonadales bacterium]|nr:2-C-methyl-D-erythritol 2,4-cyclodiphosphate synthase [Pseudomonadales bacterium]